MSWQMPLMSFEGQETVFTSIDTEVNIDDATLWNFGKRSCRTSTRQVER